jgi:hypothetical protein
VSDAQPRPPSRMWVQGIAPDPVNRDIHDWYPTPRDGIEALLAVERFSGPIWEPARGDGSISKVLEEHGYAVVSTDLIDRGYGTGRIDFLSERRARAPNIVTNPPFKHIDGFIHHSLRLARGKVALLARLAMIEGASRRTMFETTPLARVWVFSKRLTIVRRGESNKHRQNGMIAFAWFVWEQEHQGKPTLGWL